MSQLIASVVAFGLAAGIAFASSSRCVSSPTGVTASRELTPNAFGRPAGVLEFDFNKGHGAGAGIEDVVLDAGIAEI